MRYPERRAAAGLWVEARPFCSGFLCRSVHTAAAAAGLAHGMPKSRSCQGVAHLQHQQHQH